MDLQNINLLLEAIEIKSSSSLLKSFSENDLQKIQITNIEKDYMKKDKSHEEESKWNKYFSKNYSLLQLYKIKNLDKKYFYNYKQHIIFVRSFDSIMYLVKKLEQLKFNHKINFIFDYDNLKFIFILDEIKYKFEFSIYKLNRDFVIIPHSIPLFFFNDQNKLKNSKKYILFIRFMLINTRGILTFLFINDYNNFYCLNNLYADKIKNKKSLFK
jgi:hypothetical protein